MLERVIQPYTGNEPFIYFSFAEQDHQRAMEIIESLREEGFRVWFHDPSIAQGSRWRVVFTDKLPSCRVFIALVTENFLASSWCMEEYGYAKDISRKVAAICVDPLLHLDGAENIPDDENLMSSLCQIRRLGKCRSWIDDYSWISDIIEHIDDEETREIRLPDFKSLSQEEYMRLEAGNLFGEELQDGWAAFNASDKIALAAIYEWNERILLELSNDAWYSLNKTACIFEKDERGNVRFLPEIQDRLFAYYREHDLDELNRNISMTLRHCFEKPSDDASQYAYLDTLLHYVDMEEGKPFLKQILKALLSGGIAVSKLDDLAMEKEVNDVVLKHLDVLEPLQKANAYLACSIERMNCKDYEASLDYAKKTLATRTGELGEKHPLVAMTHGHIARVYRHWGDFDNALPQAKQSVDLFIDTLGKEHPMTAVAINRLAYTYKCKGETDQSIALNEEALQIYKGLAADAKPLAQDFQADSYEDEIDCYFDLMPSGKTGLSWKQVQMINIYVDIAYSYIHKKDYRQAVKMLEDARDVARDSEMLDEPFFKELDEHIRIWSDKIIELH